MNILGKIDPQPPPGIKYMLGDETWMPPENRSPRDLESLLDSLRDDERRSARR